MDYKVFYRKYRPKNFNELVGQDNIKEILINSIKLNKIAHAYIFTGPRGTGKTSTAKIFAKTLNCIDNLNGISCEKCDMCINYLESPDIIEIDAASNNGVEEIRSLRDSVKIAPYNSKYKIYIIDEVHMLSNSAWNAFLKTLEEPPSHVIFILATTELNKVPETVKSRCQTFNFSKINDNLLMEHLSNICKLENIDITDEALMEICKLSNGCLRDALSYLDKISKFQCKVDEKLIEDTFGVLNSTKLIELYNAICENNIDSINKIVDKISETGITPSNFINEFVNFMLNKIINKEVKEYKEMNFIKDIINKLNSLISNFNSIINPFILIKVELLSINYFPGNNLSEKTSKNESSKDVESIKNNKDSVNKETNNLVENKLDNKVISNIDTIKEIRINNSFVSASKDNKNVFLEKWSSLIEELNINNDYNVLGYIENASVEVVSNTNVLFSLPTENDSIIFNNNLLVIEDKYNSKNNAKFKFIGLSVDEWKKEKEKFIKNKNKKYEYIEEKIDLNSSEAEMLAEDLFGENIIEIR